MQIRQRQLCDTQAVKAILESARLPLEGLELTAGWVAERDGRILGHVAVEIAPDAAVLRSLVVDPSACGQGLALRLTEAAELAMGDRTLVLRTESVGGWVARRGFVRATLDQVPASLRRSTQFAGSLCSRCPIYIKRPGAELLEPDAIKRDVRARCGSIGYAPEDLGTAPECAELGLGRGNPLPLASLATGEVVLDLGTGAGIDAFLAPRRICPQGRVIGVDMTPGMLAKARLLAERYGRGNAVLRQGDIENLPVDDASVDGILSNCVINLTTDKVRTFREAYRVPRPGGPAEGGPPRCHRIGRVPGCDRGRRVHVRLRNPHADPAGSGPRLRPEPHRRGSPSRRLLGGEPEGLGNAACDHR